MVRPSATTSRVIPIITVGRTALRRRTRSAQAFVFAPEPDELGVRKTENGLAEIDVAHELSWHDGYNGAMVSRTRDRPRATSASWPGTTWSTGSEGYTGFCAASLVGQQDGFLAPIVPGQRRVDRRDLTVASWSPNRRARRNRQESPLAGPLLARATAIVPVSSGKIVAILTEDGYPGESQLYYVHRR